MGCGAMLGRGVGAGRPRRCRRRVGDASLSSRASVALLLPCVVLALVTRGAAAATHPGDAAALRALYRDTQQCEGGWLASAGWQATGGDPCDEGWHGVSCAAGRVVQLVLNQNGLCGPLTPVSTLRAVAHVELEGNQLTGSIAAVAPLTDLTTLIAGVNQLSGDVAALAQLTRLRDLRLHNNSLSGSIGALARLTSLEMLKLSNNNVGGDMDELAALTQLQSLELSGNNLEGGVGVLQHMTSLTFVDLADNSLEGPLDALSALTNVIDIRVNHNSFSGTLASVVGLQHLTTLLVHNNALRGALDVSALDSLTKLVVKNNEGVTAWAGHTPFAPTLQYLDCSSTGISSLPEGAFTQCADSLEVVSLSAAFPQPCPPGQVARVAPVSDEHYCERNQTEGLVAFFEVTGGGTGGWTTDSGWSTSVSDAAHVCTGNGGGPWFGVTCDEAGERVIGLTLNENGLAGTFPGAALASLSSLLSVELVTNELSGSIDGVAVLTGLTSLQLSQNSLSGTIGEVSGLLSLEHLHLDRNGFTGDAQAVAMLTSLLTLDLSGNELAGTLEPLANLVQLTELYCFANDFHGTLDPLARLTHLSKLYAYENDLAGSLRPLANLTALSGLRLSETGLSGDLEPLVGMRDLEYLSMSGNELSGGLEALAGLDSLESLRLSKNHISGELTALSALRSLTSLRLDDNELRGSIDAVGELINLSRLHLNDNAFTGGIDAVASLGELTELWLSNNQLSGGLSALASAQNLVEVRMQSNLFTGSLSPLAELPHLEVLYTYDNDLDGAVELDSMHALSWCLINDNAGIHSVVGSGLPDALVALDIHNTGVTSLPEGIFSQRAGSLASVVLGSAFPQPCPPGQVARVAPVSDEHYCERNQTEGLVAFFEATGGGTGGWTTDSGWSTSVSDAAHVCTGNGGGPWFGVTCDEAGERVIGLTLNENGLAGTFPGAALASLSSLLSVELVTNELSGSIDGVAMLTGLTSLQLSRNSLSGTIGEVSGLLSLKHLHLDRNGFTGDAQAVAMLTSLLTLDLSGNELGGTLEPLANLEELTHLYLSANDIHGSLEPLARLTRLNILYAYSNDLEGSLQPLANLTALGGVRLSGNRLSGDLEPLAGMSHVSYILLDENQLSGTLAPLAELTSLNELVLSGNQIWGELGPLRDLAGMRRMVLGGTLLTGTINVVARMPHLHTLWLHNCELNGGLDALAGRSELLDLRLQNNRFNGTLQPVEGLSRMIYMFVNGNQLAGTLSVEALPDLRYLSIHSNPGITAITGDEPLPASLETILTYGTGIASLPESAFSACADAISSVSLGDDMFPNPCPPGQVARSAPVSGEHYCERNQTEGLAALFEVTGGSAGDWTTDSGWSTSVSDAAHVCTGNGGGPWFGVTCDEAGERVIELRLNENGLSGALPSAALASLSSLRTLECGGHGFTGTVNGLAVLTELRVLSLYDNDLSGYIDTLAGIPHLSEVYLGSNQFTGDLQPLARLKQLTVLSAGDNYLEGQLNVLAGLTSLVELNLEDNSLTGGIDVVAGMTGLNFLSLRTNALVGSLDALAPLTSLTDVNLGANGFTGGIAAVSGLVELTRLRIPSNSLSGGLDAVSGLSKLEVLWTYRNQFHGTLDPLASLERLEYIHLDDNMLHGSLDVLTGLPALLRLYVPGNRFSGEIPDALRTLPQLFSVDLSDNDLSAVVTDEFAAWCASIECDIDAPQLHTNADDRNALLELVGWAHNASVQQAAAEPWAAGSSVDAAGDPCQAPWPGVVCDHAGTVRHVSLPAAAAVVVDNGESRALPPSILELGEARELDIADAAAAHWPEATIQSVESSLPPPSQATRAEVQLATGGKPGLRVVDEADVWVAWRHANSSSPALLGAAPSQRVSFNASTGVTGAVVDAADATGWPTTAADLEVSLHASAYSNEPGFVANPALPTAAVVATWRVDTLPPTATVVQAPAAHEPSRVVEVAFGASEPGCTFDVSTDGGASWVPASAADDGGAGGGAGDASLFSGATAFESVPPRVTPASTATVHLRETPGVGSFQVAVDGGPWEVWPDGSFAVELTGLEPGQHSVAARALQAGTGIADAEPVGYSWLVDPEAPDPAGQLTVAVVAGPPPVSPVSTASFALQSSHESAFFEYRLDDGPWRPTLAEFTVGPVPSGQHQLDVRSASAEQRDGAFAAVATATWSWRYKPEGSGLRVAVPADGIYELTGRATDPSGNLGPAAMPPVPFAVDTVEPETTAAVAPGSTTPWPSSIDGRSGSKPVRSDVQTVLSAGGTHVVVAAADGPGGSAGCNGCTVACRATTSAAVALNSSAEVQCGEVAAPDSANATVVMTAMLEHGSDDGLIDEFPDGAVSLLLAARDASGNTDGTPALVPVLLDRFPPETTGISAPEAVRYLNQSAVVNSSDVTVVAECTDAAGVGCAFSLSVVEGGPVEGVYHLPRVESQLDESSVRLEGLPDGVHRLEVAAWDAAGHVDATPAELSVVVDTTAPTTRLAWSSGESAQRLTDGEPVRDGELSVAASAADIGELLEGFRVCVDAAVADVVDPNSTAPIGLSALDAVGGACSATQLALDAAESLPLAFVPPFPRDSDGLGAGAVVWLVGLRSGAWRVSVWAVDAAGNAATAPAMLSASVDRRAPVVVAGRDAAADAALVTNVRTVALPVELTEPDCVLEVSVDGAAAAEQLAQLETAFVPLSLEADDADGLHGVRIWATDSAGNRAAEALEWSWWLDSTPPIVDVAPLVDALSGTLGVTPSAAIASADVAPTVPSGATCAGEVYEGAAPGARCDVRYRVGGSTDIQELAAGTSWQPLGPLEDGIHVVYVSARDAAGNEAAQLVVSWVVDTQPPLVGAVAAPRHVNADSLLLPLTCVDRSRCTLLVRVIGSRSSACASATDAEAVAADGDDDNDDDDLADPATPWSELPPHEWVDASSGASADLNGSAPLRFSFEAALVGLGDGEQRVEVRAVDGAGHPSGVTATASFFVDTVAPARPSFDSAPPVFTKDTTWTWALRVPGEQLAPEDAQDATVVQVELTEPLRGVQPWRTLAIGDADTAITNDVARLTLTTEFEGRHALSVRARDAAGNVGAVETYEWFIATSEPKTTLLQRPAEVSGLDFARFLFGASFDDQDGQAGVDLLQSNVTVEVRLGSADWEAASEGCTLSAAHQRVECEHVLHSLVPSPYVLSARARNGAGIVDPAPVTVSWEVKLCGGDEYEQIGPGGSLSCVPCPRGADCGDDVTRPNVTHAGIGALPGWWTSGSASDVYIPCPLQSACLGGDDAGNRSRCATGHTSRLCSLCEDGYFARFDGCAPCPETEAASWAFIIGVGASLVALAFLVFKMSAFLPMGMIKVTASGMQILASASAVYSVPWPPQIAWLLDALRVSLLELMTLLRISCASPMSFFASFTLTLLVFKGVAAAVVVAMAWRSVMQRRREAQTRRLRACAAGAAGADARAARRRRSSVAAVASNVLDTTDVLRGGMDWWKVFRVLAMYLLLAYPGVGMKLLRVFSCVDIEGTSWLVADMRERCYDATWGFFAVWSAVMIAVYTLGLPALITVVLWRHRHRLAEPEVVDRLGFLYVEHGEHAYFGEALELLRKLLLSSLPLYFDPGSAIQLLYALVVSFAASVFHAGLKPFKHQRRAYWLQHMSLAATFSLFAMGLVYQTNGLDTQSAAFEALSWLLLVVQATFVVTSLVLIVHAVVVALRAAARKRDLVSNLSRFVTATRAVRALSPGNGNGRGDPGVAGDGAGTAAARVAREGRSNPMHGRRSQRGGAMMMTNGGGGGAREVELSPMGGDDVPWQSNPMRDPAPQ